MIKRAWGVSSGLIVLWGGLVYFYLKACGPLWTRWYDNDYVHGYAVIPFALWLLWYRRDWFPGFRRMKSEQLAGSEGVPPVPEVVRSTQIGSDSDSLMETGSADSGSAGERDARTSESSMNPDGGSHSSSQTRTSRAFSWDTFVRLLRTNRFCQACALLLLGAMIQFAGQIVYYQVEVAAQVAVRNAITTTDTADAVDESDVVAGTDTASVTDTVVATDTASMTDAVNEANAIEAATTDANAADEIHPPQQLQDELKFGVPGIATDFSRQQIIDSLKSQPGISAFQLSFVRFYGDFICLLVGWGCFFGAAYCLSYSMVASWLDAVRPTVWGWFWGGVFLLLGGIVRIAGSFLSDPVLYPASLVPLLLGVVFLVGGTRLARWSAPSILFLGFMIPLPELLSIMFADKLQLIGTTVSVWILQLFGIAADSSGNVITLPDGHLMGVIGACSGLKMLVLFFCICTAGMFIMRGNWFEKTVVLVSAIPIAILSNVFRITITGFLYMYADSASAEKFFHDGAGMFMAPFAMLLLWGEIELMAMLFIEPTPAESEVVPTVASSCRSVSSEKTAISQKSTSSDDQSVQEELNR